MGSESQFCPKKKKGAQNPTRCRQTPKTTRCRARANREKDGIDARRKSEREIASEVHHGVRSSLFTGGLFRSMEEVEVEVEVEVTIAVAREEGAAASGACQRKPTPREAGRRPRGWAKQKRDDRFEDWWLMRGERDAAEICAGGGKKEKKA